MPTLLSRYNTLHFSNWSLEVTAAVNTYQATVIREAQLGYDGQDIPGAPSLIIKTEFITLTKYLLFRTSMELLWGSSVFNNCDYNHR